MEKYHFAGIQAGHAIKLPLDADYVRQLIPAAWTDDWEVCVLSESSLCVSVIPLIYQSPKPGYAHLALKRRSDDTFWGIEIVRLEEFPYRALQILRYQEQMDAYLRSVVVHTTLSSYEKALRALSRIHKRDVPGPQVNQFDAFKAYFDAMSSGNEPCQKERFQ
ncbi:hypothetical protein Bwad005_08780 [Bilophila wadsworthia]|jgi:hypothetical protein|uniref:hypothetical protein n=1 Tax=Bilophila TaxID=35832 RepID=UPI000223788E|nr:MULTISPECIES: hypothetical protein [Bilophila]EGW43082.1 hypothetical protein HMPREF0178_03982 [Bilophila sp. 4_1_30]